MNSLKSHLLKVAELNLAMVLISTSGPLGRYIQLPPQVTIGIRAVLAGFFLFLFCRWGKRSLRFQTKADVKVILLSGVFLTLHWVTYFYALQWSSVAIGMLSIFTYPVMTAFLEPVFLGSRFKKIHLVLGVMILTGVYFLVPAFDLGNQTTLAVIFGLVSAFFYSLRNILVKPKMKHYDGSVIMFYQIVVVALLLSPVLIGFDWERSSGQWLPLFALALLTTSLGHTLFLGSFKHFSVTTASILSSIQPLYGILLGWVFLAEVPGWKTAIGGVFILSAVAIESILAARNTQ